MRVHLPLPDESAVPVAEWPREIDEAVLIFVEHPNLAFARDEAEGDQWRGWFRAHWTDFNGGGWVWFGLLGTITHVMPDIDDPRSPHFKGAEQP
jgi:hypothetical protein